ncbi:hypothetical protein ZWY2020_033584 [Hordeum vulgare]|nr:hypothetical protein ZWY2020_033584 [Hordeum vulgare]
MTSSGRSTSPSRRSPPVDRRGCLPRRPTRGARSPSPPRPASDPDPAPRILRHGGCSASPAGPSVELAPLLQLRDLRHLISPSGSEEIAGSPTAEGTMMTHCTRIKSIVVAPSPGCRLSSSGTDPGWTEVSARKGGRPPFDPSVPRERRALQRPARLQALNAGTPPPLYPFRGRCFRCLSKRHRLLDCRDPIHCITCRRAGHIAKRCPQNHLVRGRGGPVRDRLGPLANLSITVTRFPPPATSTMSQLSPAMLRHLDHARRPRATCSVTIPSPAIDQAVFFLHSHAVTLTAADGVNATSPMAVGRALEGLLSVPVHSLRVTTHHPEHFLVLFTQPAHQVNAVRRGSIRVEGASFNIASWHEHDHAVFDSLL